MGAFLLLGPAVQAGTTATNLWTFRFAKHAGANESLCTPAVADDGTIYAGDFEGRMHALNPEGKELWRFLTGREIKSSPAIADDGTIYFGSRDRNFYALTPAGKLKWKFGTGAWVDSSPAVAVDGTIYFGSWDKNFYALNADGSLKWKLTVGAIVDSSPAIGVDGTIYFGAHDKKFYALAPDGKPRWMFATGAEVSSSPAIGDDGSLYFTSTDGNVYHLKADGTEIWHCHTGGGGDGSPVLTEDGHIAVAVGYRNVVISAEGKIVWDWSGSVWMDGTPAIAHETILFSTPWCRIWGCQMSGKPVWEAALQYDLTSSTVLSAQGNLYYCAGPALQSLQTPEPLIPARSSWPMFRGNAHHNGRAKAL